MGGDAPRHRLVLRVILPARPETGRPVADATAYGPSEPHEPHGFPSCPRAPDYVREAAPGDVGDGRFDRLARIRPSISGICASLRNPRSGTVDTDAGPGKLPHARSCPRPPHTGASHDVDAFADRPGKADGGAGSPQPVRSRGASRGTSSRPPENAFPAHSMAWPSCWTWTSRPSRAGSPAAGRWRPCCPLSSCGSAATCSGTVDAFRSHPLSGWVCTRTAVHMIAWVLTGVTPKALPRPRRPHRAGADRLPSLRPSPEVRRFLHGGPHAGVGRGRAAPQPRGSPRPRSRLRGSERTRCGR